MLAGAFERLLESETYGVTVKIGHDLLPGHALGIAGHSFLPFAGFRHGLKGAGFKSNYFDVETGEDYWISGPKRDGSDRLYGGRVPIEIDDDVREEYWKVVRGQPENVQANVV